MKFRRKFIVLSRKKANETQFATYIHTVEDRGGKKKRLKLTNFLRLGTTLTKYYTFINFYYSALRGRPMSMSKQKLEKTRLCECCLKKMNCIHRCCCFILTSFLALNPAFLCFAWIINIKTPTARINAAAAATKIQRSKETLGEGEVSPEVNKNYNES